MMESFMHGSWRDRRSTFHTLRAQSRTVPHKPGEVVGTTFLTPRVDVGARDLALGGAPWSSPTARREPPFVERLEDALLGACVLCLVVGLSAFGGAA